MKIYVDSRNRISGSNEDFSFQLPETVDIPESLAYLDVVLVPNVFWTVRTGYNDKLYLYERKPDPILSYQINEAYRAITLPSGQYNGYTLAQAVEAAMNAGRTLPAAYVVVFNATTGRFDFSNNLAAAEQFTLYPTAYLLTQLDAWNAATGAGLSKDNVHDAGRVLGLNGAQAISRASSNTIISGDSSVNMLTHHTLFVHSNLGALGDSYGPRGESDIIRRVVLDSPQNSINVDRHTTAHDNVKVLRQSLRSMDFRLADAEGRTVDLQGQHWSFSVILHEQ